jgi:hypothetical protein
MNPPRSGEPRQGGATILMMPPRPQPTRRETTASAGDEPSPPAEEPGYGQGV